MLRLTLSSSPSRKATKHNKNLLYDCDQSLLCGTVHASFPDEMIITLFLQESITQHAILRQTTRQKESVPTAMKKTTKTTKPDCAQTKREHRGNQQMRVLLPISIVLTVSVAQPFRNIFRHTIKIQHNEENERHGCFVQTLLLMSHTSVSRHGGRRPAPTTKKQKQIPNPCNHNHTVL